MIFMKKTLVETGRALALTGNKLVLWAKQKSPELLLAGSILAAAGSVILAIRATMKLESTATKVNKKISTVKEKMKDDNKLASGEYTLPTLKKELTVEYVKAAWEFTKLYGPAALSFGLYLAGTLGSHKIMKGRNLALSSALSLVKTSFDSYRDRVKNKYGEDAEHDIYTDSYDEKITIDKDGKKKTVTVKQPHIDPNLDLYSFIFDESHEDWTKDTMTNIDNLLTKERYLNRKFISQGYMFLYDVYQTIGMYPDQLSPDKIQASKLLGWIYDPSDDTRDNYISFGLADPMGNLNKKTMEVIRNHGRSFWLTFNPDGDILTGKNGQKTFMQYVKEIRD